MVKLESVCECVHWVFLMQCEWCELLRNPFLDVAGYISKTPPCPAVVPYICFSTSGVKLIVLDTGTGALAPPWNRLLPIPLQMNMIGHHALSQRLILPPGHLKGPLATSKWHTLLVYSGCRHGKCKQINYSNLPYLSDVMSLIVLERNYAIFSMPCYLP